MQKSMQSNVAEIRMNTPRISNPNCHLREEKVTATLKSFVQEEKILLKTVTE